MPHRLSTRFSSVMAIFVELDRSLSKAASALDGLRRWPS
jgi:hypothetical protein